MSATDNLLDKATETLSDTVGTVADAASHAVSEIAGRYDDLTDHRKRGPNRTIMMVIGGALVVVAIAVLVRRRRCGSTTIDAPTLLAEAGEGKVPAA